VTALYRKIAGELREQIISGTLKPGDRLPTEPQLVEQHGVSRNTVRLATGLLVNEGLVEHVPGRTGGMFVRQRITLTYHASRAEMPSGGGWSESDAWFGEVRAQGYEPSQDFEVKVVALPADIAERLGVEPDSPAALRTCIRKVNGVPSSIQATFYPMSLCDEVPELLSPHNIPQGTTQFLAERGYPQPAARDEMMAVMPTPEQATLLSLTPGTPVLAYIRTGYAVARPVRVSVTTFAGDRNRVVHTIGDPDVIARYEDAE
jgi:GntR family transcriptional regulator